MTHPITNLRRLVREGPSDAPGRTVDALGRIGLVGYGVVHLLVAWLALQVTFGVPDLAPDAQGAVGTIAGQPGGAAVLGVIVVGLLAFVFWQLTAAAIGFRWAVAGSASASGSARCPSRSRSPGWPRRTFMGDLAVERLAPWLQCAIELVGAVGHLARALTLAVVGVLAAAAALNADPGWAGGLDVALRALGSTALGSSLLVAVAAGFAAFGLFCFADAGTRRA